jgi:putative holliday junction resolvase
VSLADIYYFLRCGTRPPAGGLKQSSLETNKYQPSLIISMNNELIKIYLGVDWGEKRIGLALADSETKLATPFKTVANVEEAARIVKSEQIDMVVVGKPVRITNYELEITNEKYNKFINNLKKKINVPVELVDERLSSKAADALAGNKKTNPLSPSLRRARASRDEIAAMIILQSYLDRMI